MDDLIIIKFTWEMIAGLVSGVVVIVGAVVSRMWLTLTKLIESTREDHQRETESLHRLLEEVLSANRALLARENRNEHQKRS